MKKVKKCTKFAILTLALVLLLFSSGCICKTDPKIISGVSKMELAYEILAEHHTALTEIKKAKLVAEKDAANSPEAKARLQELIDREDKILRSIEKMKTAIQKMREALENE